MDSVSEISLPPLVAGDRHARAHTRTRTRRRTHRHRNTKTHIAAEWLMRRPMRSPCWADLKGVDVLSQAQLTLLKLKTAVLALFLTS